MERSTRAGDTAGGMPVQKLIDRYRGGDLRAREKLVRDLLPLAKRLAAR